MPPVNRVSNTTPTFFKVFKALGCEVHYPGGKDGYCLCPSCTSDNKLGVSAIDGRFRCVKCEFKGNKDSFPRHLWELGFQNKDDQAYRELADNRHLFDVETLEEWGLARNPVTDEWLVPVYGPDSQVKSVYRYTRAANRMVLMALPGMSQGLLGTHLYNPKKSTVYLVEGLWDAMVLWESLRHSRRDGEYLRFTEDVKTSLYAESNVLAVPGAGVFNPDWLGYVSGKKVILCYDNDHPKFEGTKEKPGSRSGYQGLLKTAAAMVSTEVRPKLLQYLFWGEDGFDPDLPDGYDLRDALAAGSLEERVQLLSDLLAWVRPVPKTLRMGAISGQNVPGEPLQRTVTLNGKVVSGGTSTNGTSSSSPSTSQENGAGTNGYHPGNGESSTGDKSEGEDEGEVPQAHLECLPCENWDELIEQWKIAFEWPRELDVGLSVMLACVASTPLAGDQLWAKLVSAPSSGKTVLCEALSVNRDFCYPKSTIRGFHTGYKADKHGLIDCSLIAKLRDKTLITKDGDTLLKSPNLEQILSEARDIYDRVSRTDYRHGLSRDYSGLAMTWILAGTHSLHALDTSELGERFIDCVLIEKMDPFLEMRIARAKAYQADRDMRQDCDGTELTMESPELIKAKQLTGGYVGYLRNNARELIRAVKESRYELDRCTELALFASYMRTKPSKTQDETVQRELCFRLSSQLTKLSGCLAVAMGRNARDDEVMRRTEKCALDTSRGHNRKIAGLLYAEGRTLGMSVAKLAEYVGLSEAKVRERLTFMTKIDAVEVFSYLGPDAKTARPRYRLTNTFHDVYEKVAGDIPVVPVESSQSE